MSTFMELYCENCNKIPKSEKGICQKLVDMSFFIRQGLVKIPKKCKFKNNYEKFEKEVRKLVEQEFEQGMISREEWRGTMDDEEVEIDELSKNPPRLSLKRNRVGEITWELYVGCDMFHVGVLSNHDDDWWNYFNLCFDAKKYPKGES